MEANSLGLPISIPLTPDPNPRTLYLPGESLSTTPLRQSVSSLYLLIASHKVWIWKLPERAQKGLATAWASTLATGFTSQERSKPESKELTPTPASQIWFREDLGQSFVCRKTLDVKWGGLQDKYCLQHTNCLRNSVQRRHFKNLLHSLSPSQHTLQPELWPTQRLP